MDLGLVLESGFKGISIVHTYITHSVIARDYYGGLVVHVLLIRTKSVSILHKNADPPQSCAELPPGHE